MTKTQSPAGSGCPPRMSESWQTTRSSASCPHCAPPAQCFLSLLTAEEARDNAARQSVATGIIATAARRSVVGTRTHPVHEKSRTRSKSRRRWPSSASVLRAKRPCGGSGLLPERKGCWHACPHPQGVTEGRERGRPAELVVGRSRLVVGRSVHGLLSVNHALLSVNHALLLQNSSIHLSAELAAEDGEEFLSAFCAITTWANEEPHTYHGGSARGEREREWR